jgi:putative SOS response-associated peptidase YedK
MENWKVPHIDEWMRTFCVITTTANELVGAIHDRMPAILPELMRIWPISTRVNKPENDDPAILERVVVEDDSTLL